MSAAASPAVGPPPRSWWFPALQDRSSSTARPTSQTQQPVGCNRGAALSVTEWISSPRRSHGKNTISHITPGESFRSDSVGGCSAEMQPHGSEPPRRDTNYPLPLRGASWLTLLCLGICFLGICRNSGTAGVWLKLDSRSESYWGRRGKQTQKNRA